MPKTQKYDIKFPIRVETKQGLFDLNKTRADYVKSLLIHLIFTPEGQKLRDPLFGTTLIRSIFNPNDDQTWEEVVYQIKEKVKKYVPNCDIQDVETSTFEDGRGLNVKIIYSVKEADGETHTYELTQTI